MVYGCAKLGGQQHNVCRTLHHADCILILVKSILHVILPVQVDGVYDSDPVLNPAAKMHKRLCYRDVTHSNLQVMDETAITLCKENGIPVIVFNVFTPGNIVRAFAGDPDIGTIVTA